MSGSAPSRSPTGWRAALRAALLSSLAVRDSLPDFREHLATLIKVTASLSVVATSGVVLAARLWLSQAVFVHGLMVMMQAEGFSHEPSGWSALAQGVLPVLLTVGLLTRPVALLLLVGSGIGLHHELSGPQIVLLIWLLVQGAGLISLDCLMGRGLTRAPIWGVHAVNGMYRFLTRVSADVLPFATRAYVAVTVAAGSGAALWPQPISGDPLTAPWWVILLCWALIAGVLTRPVGLLFCLAAPLSSLAGAGHDEIGLMLLLLLLAGSGAGKLSLDRMLAEAAASGGVTPPEMADSLPHVVVVGGGFGGMAVVRALRSAPCRITLIDRRNHSLFQPLLYQVATAALSPADIALPIRTALRGQQNVGIRLAEVVGVDRDQRRVLLHEGVLPFDHLVLATGARHGYFGHDEWATLAPGLKSIEDATAIRGRLLRAFEEAENEADPDRQKAWLTFVIVGGGPTGVELAGALAELARTGMEREYRRIDPTTARVILAQSGARRYRPSRRTPPFEPRDPCWRSGWRFSSGRGSPELTRRVLISTTCASRRAPLCGPRGLPPHPRPSGWDRQATAPAVWSSPTVYLCPVAKTSLRSATPPPRTPGAEIRCPALHPPPDNRANTSRASSGRRSVTRRHLLRSGIGTMATLPRSGVFPRSPSFQPFASGGPSHGGSGVLPMCSSWPDGETERL
jgi:hypothetical protein